MNPLLPRYRRIAVLAPSAATTGGPELLHQLVSEIRSHGGNAFIHYVPDAGAAVPERYRCYDTPVLRTLDLAAGDCIVAPETMLRELPLLSAADRFIWWLSFDFFVSRRGSRLGRIAANSYKALLLQLLTRTGLKHLFQSHYARARLRRQLIGGALLSDYLALEAAPADSAPREDMILYNPKKGIEVTDRLRQLCPHLRFVPIINMTKAEVEDAFRRAKIYIDFGEHPGKDRLPREAAMMRTVVVVGSRGSAAFDEDVPLAGTYKLAVDETLPVRFLRLVDAILADFPAHQTAQEPYRAVIARERSLFANQVRDVFFRSPLPQHDLAREAPPVGQS
jgi:hypothetical protein